MQLESVMDWTVLCSPLPLKIKKVGILTPNSSQCDLIWRKSTGHELMRVNPMPVWLGSIYEGDIWPQRQTYSEGRQCEVTGRRLLSTNQGERQQRKPTLLTHDLGLSASETVRPSVSIIPDPPVCGSLVTAALGNWSRGKRQSFWLEGQGREESGWLPGGSVIWIQTDWPRRTGGISHCNWASAHQGPASKQKI